MSDKNEGYVDYQPDDTKYAGAKEVVDAELEHLKSRRQSEPDQLKGLALSGGGIRSASFCLGVVQTLAKYKKLQMFDYLSTVSGGGYLGGALSWLWLGKWKRADTCNKTFGTEESNFPFGTGSRHSNPDKSIDKDQAILMRHLRQHGKYLTPGKGITALSFLSVILRSLTMGIITLLVLASFAFHFLHYMHYFDTGFLVDTNAYDTYALGVGLFAVVFYFLSLLLYGFVTLFLRKYNKQKQAYGWRRLWEVWIARVLILVLGLLTVAVAEVLRVYIVAEIQSAGGLSAVLGGLIVWYSQKTNKSDILKKIPASIIVNVGLVVMFIGMVVLSNQMAHDIIEYNKSLLCVELGLLLHLSIACFILLMAYLIPINKVSIHRYYRDRLMETFTPDVCDVLNGEETAIAVEANNICLHDCLSGEGNDMPYHIINSNIVLVESKEAKFKGRGGDNFILSPLYSGSNATGWKNSKNFAGGSITLPTAVAISGAAANSDSGVAGKGLTLNPLVSVLMTIFNLRLGYWAVNPDGTYQSNQSAIPNYLIPGFSGILRRKKLNENAGFVQLSDGGHFENLAVYELIRRHCRLIVCCDAEQDKDFVFESLSNIVEKSRVDFGVHIDINADDIDKLKYKQSKGDHISFAKQGYLVADINYPNNEAVGKLIYIKTTLTDCLPADVMGYKSLHPAFPDESTIDQFFDEKQMEAYRVLGMHIAESVIKDKSIVW